MTSSRDSRAVASVSSVARGGLASALEIVLGSTSDRHLSLTASCLGLTSAPCHCAQAGKLYVESGQFNPHAARSQRKQAKKLQRKQVSTQSGAGDDFDFAEAFQEVHVGSDEENEEE